MGHHRFPYSSPLQIKVVLCAILDNKWVCISLFYLLEDCDFTLNAKRVGF